MTTNIFWVTLNLKLYRSGVVSTIILFSRKKFITVSLASLSSNLSIITFLKWCLQLQDHCKYEPSSSASALLFWNCKLNWKGTKMWIPLTMEEENFLFKRRKKKEKKKEYFHPCFKYSSIFCNFQMNIYREKYILPTCDLTCLYITYPWFEN